MRDVIADSKTRQRESILGILKQVTVPGMRGRVLPSFRDVLAASVTVTPGFVVVPPPPVPRGGVVGGGGTASGSAAAAGPPTPVPTATPVRTNKKARTEAEDALRALPLGDVCTDADWLLDEALDGAAESLITAMSESRVAAMLNRLDKLPGKLMLY